MKHRAYWIVAGGLLIDQISKSWANHALSFIEPVKGIDSVLLFQLVHNYGAAYGVFQNQRGFLIVFSLFILAILLGFRRFWVSSKWSNMGHAFLISGTVGNLIDRVCHGYVIDFIYIHIFPVFNIADVMIDMGIICFILDIFVKKSESYVD